MTPEKKSPKKQPSQTVTEPSQEPAARKEYDIDIYRAWCKQCGLCAAFCPRECLALN